MTEQTMLTLRRMLEAYDLECFGYTVNCLGVMLVRKTPGSWVQERFEWHGKEIFWGASSSLCSSPLQATEFVLRCLGIEPELELHYLVLLELEG